MDELKCKFYLRHLTHHTTPVYTSIYFFIYVLDNNFRSDEENELDPMPQCAFTRRL